ncbi:MAG: DNA-processing protein DprA [Proteobacteria bacterium]|nr:DNA-processing protein DprA [Pseudomonadota bacterium]
MTDSLFGSIPQSALPQTHDDKVLWLQLIRSRRVGPATFMRLMGDYGTAGAALDALPGIAAAAGVNNYHVYPKAEAQREYETGRVKRARLLCIGTPEYSQVLADISDAPPVIWARGRVDLLLRDSVALVGARNASSLGTRMAKLLASDLGKAGYVVTSGLARGIDAAAHHAALPTGTIAVMAGGVDVIYPVENQKLADEIAETGLLISEQPMGLAPQARHFPRRNRIVSGLSRAVVVVEGAAKSGSLITAREAADQGRDVMAVPGHPLDTRATGCNMLIRDGAVLVRSASDVIEALGVPQQAPRPDPIVPSRLTIQEPPKATISEAMDLSRKILSLLGPAPIPEDQLIRELNAPAAAVSSHPVTLELDGRLQRHTGGMLALVV